VTLFKQLINQVPKENLETAYPLFCFCRLYRSNHKYTH